MYVRSYRRPVSPVPPPDYSGTALSDVSVPPPAPVSAGAGEREEDAGTEMTSFPAQTLPSETFSAPEAEKPVSAIRKELSSFGSDDWLLLGLIFLFLTGSAEEVKDQLVLLILLGVLFFTGRGGFPLFG